MAPSSWHRQDKLDDVVETIELISYTVLRARILAFASDQSIIQLISLNFNWR